MLNEAAISWGSKKQATVALSSCEAEINALSEATKDVVYLRTTERHNGKSNGPEYILASGEGDSA